MDKELWIKNFNELWRTATLWTTVAVTSLASWYMSLSPTEQLSFLDSLPIARWLVPVVGVLLPIVVARAWPQKSLQK